MAGDWTYRGVDADLSRGLNARAARTGRGGVRIDGQAPTGAKPIDLKGLSALARTAISSAGYRESKALTDFDIDTLEEVLGAKDLDIIVRAVIRGQYAGVKGLPAKDIDRLADRYLGPADVRWALPRCGDTFGAPDTGFFELPPDVLDQLRPREKVDLMRDPREPKGPPWAVPGGGWTDPVRDRGTLVDLDPDLAARTRFDERDTLEALITLDDRQVVAQVDQLVRGAQAALAAGDRQLALKAASRILAVKPARGTDAVFAHVHGTVAPAIAIAAAGDAPWAGQAAAMVLRSSPAGLGAAAVARSAFLRDRRAAIDTIQRVAATGPARGRRDRMRVARDELARVAIGLDEDGKGVSAALTTQSIAAITDLTRAVYGMSLPPDAKAFPPGAPKGVAGRALVAPGWMVGAGGLSAFGPADGKALALRAFDIAGDLDCPDLPLLGGDLFRFDWLLGEVRATVDQLEHLDVLLVGLIEQLADIVGDITELAGEAMDAIAKLVEQIRQQVDRLATEIQRTLGEVLKAATSATVLLGALKVIGDWKWDQWLALLGVIGGAIGAGADPVAAVDAWIIGELRLGIAAGLVPALTEFDTFAASITATLSGVVVPETLLVSLETLLATSGLLPSSLTPAQRRQQAADLLAPILAARDAAVASLTAEVAAARAAIVALGTTATFSPELRVLVFVYLVAPLVNGLIIATAVVLGGGPWGLILAAALHALGVEVIERIVVGVLGDLTGIVRNIQATARAGLAVAAGLLAQLRTLLATMGGLEALLGALTAKINRLADALLPETVAQLQTALLSARDGIRSQLRTLLAALDRSFFRETLTAVAQPNELSLLTPARPAAPDTTDPNRRPDLGPLYGDLTLATQLASLLPRYEATRVAAQTLTGVRQVFTHVLSLADVLGLPERATPVGTTLQTLLAAGGKLPFSLGPQLFDRVAPGVHGLLIKDIALQFDFATPVADEQAVTALLGALGPAAGGAIDPALVARTAGFGMPGLPIVPARVPTGVPAVLNSGCTTYVRLSPTLAHPLIPFLCEDDCGRPAPASERPPALTNVELLDDPDAGANAAGWRMLALHDMPQSLMFSHFEVLTDAVRFIAEPKQLKPFELRGAIGNWELEIPAIVQNFVTHHLPPIRDVRLIFSTEGQWSSELADTLTAPAAATEAQQPRGELPTTLDELLDLVGDLLDATNLQTLVSLRQLQLPPVTLPGNFMVPVPLDAATLTNNAQVLLGTQDAVFDVTTATLTGAGLTVAKLQAPNQGLREVRVGLLPGGTAFGSSLAPVPVTVSYKPTATAAAATRVVTTTNGAATVPLSHLGNPASPIGIWTLRVGALPALTTLSAAALTLVVESQP